MPQAEALVIVIVNRTRIGFSLFLWGKGGKTPGGGQKERVWCFLVHSSALRRPALFMIRENTTNPLSMNSFSFFLPQLFFNANLRIPQMLKHTIVISFITSEDRGVLHSYRPSQAVLLSTGIITLLLLSRCSTQVHFWICPDQNDAANGGCDAADTLLQRFPVKSTQFYGADVR